MIVPIEFLAPLNKKDLLNIKINDEMNIWVYSYDTLRRAVIPVKVYIKFVLFEKCQGYQIELDNGNHLFITEEAKILMRNGNYKKVSEIYNNDSIMPFCLSSWGQPKNYPKIPHRSIMRKYEHVYQPWYNMWESAHRMILREKLNRPIKRKHVCHHIDEDYLNNNPDNLAEIKVKEHNKLNKKFLISEECRKKQIENSKRAAKKRWSVKKYRDKHSKFMIKENERRRNNFEYRKKLSENVSKGRMNIRCLLNGKTIEEEKKIYKEVIKREPTFKRAAESLGMHPNTLRRRLRKHCLIKEKISRDDLEFIKHPSLKEKKTKELIDLMEKHITIKAAAESLGIHPQTLSRKLSLYGVWDKLVNLNNHRVTRTKVISLSGKFIDIISDNNIGLSCGAFVI